MSRCFRVKTNLTLPSHQKFVSTFNFLEKGRTMERGEASGNKLVQILNIKDQKTIVIKENHLAEAHFLIPHLLAKILNQNFAEICFVTLHKTLEHYRMLCRKLGYKLEENNRLFSIENFHEIVFELGDVPRADVSEYVAKQFLGKILAIANQLNRNKYLIIDDITHLLDLGVEVKHVMNLINVLINMNITCIIGTHKSEESNDEIITNALEYVADLTLEVSPLKTGRSSAVTGILHLKRQNCQQSEISTEMYHYKTVDNGVNVFRPGESIRYLLQ